MEEKVDLTPTPENTESSATDTPKPETVRFSASDWLILPGAVALAVLFRSVFGLDALLESGRLPGLGAFLFTAALLLLSGLYLGKRLQFTRSAVFFTVCTLLLALCCAVYGNESIRVLNLGLLAVLCPITLILLSGRGKHSWQQVGVLGDALGLTFTAPFAHCFKPFRAVGSLFKLKSGRAKLGYGIMGLALSLPLLLLIVVLLSSADAVFGSIFTKLGELLSSGTLPNNLRTALILTLLTLMSFSLFYTLRTPKKEQDPAEIAAEPMAVPAALFTPTLALLDVIYAVFVAVQFACLFGGAETAAMEGGYAQYARTGFFQLVAVAAINVAAVLTSVCAMPKPLSRAVKVLCLVMVGFTLVILASSLWRMVLYISVYGMTVLRVFTLWGIGFITICLFAVGYKVIKPEFKFWPLFLVVGLCGYLVLNFVNVDARIAEHNVNAYLSGDLEYVDVRYLSSLSGDALPALKRLQQAEPGYYNGTGVGAAIEKLEHHCTARSWRDWNLSYHHIK